MPPDKLCVRYRLKLVSDGTCWEFLPHEMKMIFLCKMKFNPCKVKLNIGRLGKPGKLKKPSKFQFSDVWFILTSHGLNFISCKRVIEVKFFTP